MGAGLGASVRSAGEQTAWEQKATQPKEARCPELGLLAGLIGLWGYLVVQLTLLPVEEVSGKKANGLLL